MLLHSENMSEAGKMHSGMYLTHKRGSEDFRTEIVQQKFMIEVEKCRKQSSRNAEKRKSESENLYEGKTLHRIISIIPGSSNVLNCKRALWYRLLWAVILFVFMFICAFHVTDRICKFWKAGTIFLTEVTVNHTVMLPAITICTNEVYGDIEEKRRYAEKYDMHICNVSWADLVGFGNITSAKDVWKFFPAKRFIKWKKTKFQAAFIENQKETVIKRSTTPTILGICETLDLSDNIIKYEYGTITYFRLSLKKPPSAEDCIRKDIIKIRIHSASHEVKHVMVRESIDVHINSSLDLILTNKKVELLNSTEHPCFDDEYYFACIDNCYKNILTENATCRLPFITNSTLPFCNTSTSVLAEFNKSLNIYNRNQDCSHCGFKCMEDKYSLIISSFRPPDTNGDIEIGIYYLDNVFQRTVQVIAYDLISCICDIGGNMGLFLGICIIHILEILGGLVEKGIGMVFRKS